MGPPSGDSPAPAVPSSSHLTRALSAGVAVAVEPDAGVLAASCFEVPFWFASVAEVVDDGGCAEAASLPPPFFARPGKRILKPLLFYGAPVVWLLLAEERGRGRCGSREAAEAAAEVEFGRRSRRVGRLPRSEEREGARMRQQRGPEKLARETGPGL